MPPNQFRAFIEGQARAQQNKAAAMQAENVGMPREIVGVLNAINLGIETLTKVVESATKEPAPEAAR
jgi:hypothetical protein